MLLIYDVSNKHSFEYACNVAKYLHLSGIKAEMWLLADGLSTNPRPSQNFIQEHSISEIYYGNLRIPGSYLVFKSAIHKWTQNRKDQKLREFMEYQIMLDETMEQSKSNCRCCCVC